MPVAQRSPKISDFLETHLMYIFLVYGSPPLASTFYVYLTIISRCVQGQSSTENCIFDQYLSEITGRLYPADERYCVTRQGNSIGATASHSPWHNTAIFREVTITTHNTLFDHFVLLKHHVYIFQMVIIRTIRFTRGNIVVTLITATPR